MGLRRTGLRRPLVFQSLKPALLVPRRKPVLLKPIGPIYSIPAVPWPNPIPIRLEGNTSGRWMSRWSCCLSYMFSVSFNTRCGCWSPNAIGPIYSIPAVPWPNPIPIRLEGTTIQWPPRNTSIKAMPLARTIEDEEMNEDMRARDRWNDPAAEFLSCSATQTSPSQTHWPDLLHPSGALAESHTD
jgi:hypothetical protein